MTYPYQDTFDRDINELAKLWVETRKYEGLPWVISVESWVIHIQESSMENIAPLSQWKLNEPRGDMSYPYEHSIVFHDVPFIAITKEPIHEDDRTRG